MYSFRKFSAALLVTTLAIGNVLSASAAYGEVDGYSNIFANSDSLEGYFIVGESTTEELTASSSKIQNIYVETQIVKKSSNRVVSSSERTDHFTDNLSLETDYMFNEPKTYFYTSGIHRIRYTDDSLSRTTSQSASKKLGLEEARSSTQDERELLQETNRNRLHLEQQANNLFEIDWDAYTFISYDDLWIINDSFTYADKQMNSILADISVASVVGDCLPFGVYYNAESNLAFTLRYLADGSIEYTQYNLDKTLASPNALSATQSREIFLNDYQIISFETITPEDSEIL